MDRMLKLFGVLVIVLGVCAIAAVFAEWHPVLENVIRGATAGGCIGAGHFLLTDY